MTLDRRMILQGGGAVIGLAMAPAILRGQQPEPIATTTHGVLRGARERGVSVFRGIPYAGSVSGPDRRFKAPPPAPSWTGIREATVYGAPSIQAGAPSGEPVPGEDCLFLNVWTPAADDKRRPVMFYSHGGGFTIGSGSRPEQNGANLARLYDVVVVETNHRLGALGYLYLGELLGPDYAGNQGLLDLVAGLKWVNANIAAFGGDPGNVMIFGESGGGGKTTCLYGMPMAAPYFHKASIESPIGPDNRGPDQGTAIARDAMKALGYTDPRQLLTAPVADLLRFQTGDFPGAETRINGRPVAVRDQLFWPIIDGTILPELPFGTHAPAISASKPLIVGGCKDESVFFLSFGDKSVFSLTEDGLRQRLATQLGDRADAWIAAFRKSRPNASPSQLYVAITTAQPWRAHAVHIAEEKARAGQAPVYSYILQYQSPLRVPGTDYPVGSPHAIDINTKFNNVAAPGADAASRGILGDTSSAKHATADNMSAMWAAFARTGKPSIPGQPEWKPYTLAKRETMLIDARCRLEADPEGAERRFWEAEPNAQQVP